MRCMTDIATVTRIPRAATLRKQEAILAEAERQFARFGFEGVSLDSIAAVLDMSRQNLLYHWPSKEELYRAVLDSVMDEWMACMTAITEASEPQAALNAYVEVKLRFSRDRATGNAVFTREIMAGAPRYQDVLKARVMPLLHADVERFERWADEGLIRRVDFMHLMFLIWSSTQAYADLAPQFALYMGKPRLEDADFEAARQLITSLIWRSLEL
ncbi:TetR family transcriptional regulator [Pelomonas puraquae]|uniref:TetR family transcriptional regulator n=2 Tax=Roseateles puraquae TaxID=431059 RepID=A0A254N671_9BURK|nr:TetR family transcriptional regulator [Roseateles puraquae]OWR02312.1 TetR family transcriptional regulator [Roseateles puraquae]